MSNEPEKLANYDDLIRVARRAIDELHRRETQVPARSLLELAAFVVGETAELDRLRERAASEDGPVEHPGDLPQRDEWPDQRVRDLLHCCPLCGVGRERCRTCGMRLPAEGGICLMRYETSSADDRYFCGEECFDAYWVVAHPKHAMAAHE